MRSPHHYYTPTTRQLHSHTSHRANKIISVSSERGNRKKYMYEVHRIIHDRQQQYSEHSPRCLSRCQKSAMSTNGRSMHPTKLTVTRNTGTTIDNAEAARRRRRGGLRKVAHATHFLNRVCFRSRIQFKFGSENRRHYHMPYNRNPHV